MDDSFPPFHRGKKLYLSFCGLTFTSLARHNRTDLKGDGLGGLYLVTQKSHVQLSAQLGVPLLVLPYCT